MKKVLDLFCGAGGVAKGLQRAGLYVVGVDINPQPRYCGDDFIQADAMTFPLNGYLFVWASPPCQSYSKNMKHLATPQPKLIEPLRERFYREGITYVIENVEGAPLINPLVLCGTMFGLRVWRHRLFESSIFIPTGFRCDHSEPPLNPHRASSRQRMYEEFGRDCNTEMVWRNEMGVSWMNKDEGREAIPPYYSEYIGKFLKGVLCGKTS